VKQENLRELPAPYVGTVRALHAFLVVEAADKESKKGLSKTAQKAFTLVTLKLKKLVKESDMEAAIKKYEAVSVQWHVHARCR
jgi:hypothetical protein